MATKNVKKILEELKALKTQLSEDYLFNGDEDGEMGYDEYDEMGDDVDPRMVQPHGNGGQEEVNSEEEVAMHAQEVIQHEPIIGKIRETAIEGLKKYSEHPTSKIYEFMKKVFLEADKVLTDTGKD